MKKVFFFCIACLCLNSINAQDILYLKDGRIIEAKIIEISSREIKFKNIESLNGPLRILEKKRVQSIQYENGQEEIFSTTNNKNKETKRSLWEDYRFSIIAGTAIPVGDFKDEQLYWGAKTGFALGVEYEYPLSEKIGLGGSLVYTHNEGEEINRINTTWGNLWGQTYLAYNQPLENGLFYGRVGLGITSLFMKIEGSSTTEANSNFGYSAEIGMKFNNQLGINLRFLSTNQEKVIYFSDGFNRTYYDNYTRIIMIGGTYSF